MPKSLLSTFENFHVLYDEISLSLKYKNKLNEDFFLDDRLLGLINQLSQKPDQSLMQDTVAKSRKVKKEIFQNEIFPIAPLYVTSYCNEHCLYCNYRAKNKIEITRKRLTEKELSNELEFLVSEKGFRNIELVYGSDPIFNSERIAKDVLTTKKYLEKYGNGLVGINSEPFNIDDYKRLHDNGLDYVVLWQETYDRNNYEKYHPGNNIKSNFSYRLLAYERMIKGGIENIGMGVLSGLSEWKTDWIIFLLHQEFLYQKYNILPKIIGTARLKSAAGGLLKPTESLLTDDELLFCLAVQNLYNPLCLPFVNTRESFDLCEKLSFGGGVLFTFNCSTIPGGYSLSTKGSQFPTHNYDKTFFSERLKEASFVVNDIVDFRTLAYKITDVL